MIDPGALYATQLGILQAVKLELDATGRLVSRACVVPGVQIAWDDCECGQLTVNLRSLYRTQQFPTPAIEGQLRCEPPYWAAEIVVTVLRCLPETDTAEPPSCATLAQAAQDQAEDMEAVQAGVTCALVNDTYRFGFHSPTLSEGLCGGSELSVFVQFANCAVECP